MKKQLHKKGAGYLLFLSVFLLFSCRSEGTMDEDRGKIEIIKFIADVFQKPAGYEFKISIKIAEAGGVSTTIYKVGFNLYSKGEIYRNINIAVSTAFPNPELQPYRTLQSSDFILIDNTHGKVPNKITIQISYREKTGYQGQVTASCDITEIN